MFAALLALAGPVAAADPPPLIDAAVAFGARQQVTNVTLSPDGKTLAYLVPTGGQSSALLTLPITGEQQPQMVLRSSGGPERLRRCNWASSTRLVCTIYVVQNTPEYGPLLVTRQIGVDAGGGNIRMLSTRSNINTHGFQADGGNVIDWLPDAGGSVLMQRAHLPDDHLDSNIGSKDEGVAVDRIDTRTLKATTVEKPRRDAVEYISDQRGNVRIMGVRGIAGETGMMSGVIHYFYRRTGSREWEKMGDIDTIARTGFNPYVIDADQNLVYGFMPDHGLQALYTVALDGSLQRKLILKRGDVDIDDLTTIGARRRVVGASYATDRRTAVYFDAALDKIVTQIHHALPKQPLVNLIGATPDEQKLLVVASSDDDPGVYYVLDRTSQQLHLTFAARPELAGHTLANVRAVSYAAADGTTIPAYLTLPPGKESARGLPAIVLPHGGPEDRDEWGFDWLPQFYAAQGYAVLQPNFRGSAGYGEAWFHKNGFQSWRTAIGDVLDAGRWLIKQGIADPARLAIVGWSYGGYAALQSAVTDPNLFKAVVAIAPVTDLATLKGESADFIDHDVVERYVGTGPQIREGSPAQNAARIKAPVILFHGTLDTTVRYSESTLMDAKLKAANVPHQLVTYPGLDHQLDDSAARADMLRKSDAFLRQAMHF